MPEHAADAADARARRLAAQVLDELLERHPVWATGLGDHRGDDRLDDLSEPALDELVRWASGRLSDLRQAVPDTPEPADRVDLQILANALEQRIFEVEQLQPHTWDPLLANPGQGIYALLARDFAPLGDRLRALAGRLRAIPPALEVARRQLEDMPRVHVETAIVQFTGTKTLIAAELEAALAKEPALRREVEPARDAAVQALDAHVDWLRARLPHSSRDPRLGAELYTRKLALTLDTDLRPADLLAQAEAELERISAQLAETARRVDGAAEPGEVETVQRVLDRLAADGHVDNDTIVGLCEQALAETAEFVRANQLVTVYDDPVKIVVMPEIHRGVAVAYCDPPGPLEREPLPTYFAISPTPEDWNEERVRSFFREYNAHMLHNLTVHEAMPGHVLQLAHNNRFRAQVPVRAALWSGSFVEGWAVYAEEVMADAGYRGAANDALRMQQLKMQLRMTLNAILDVRVHAGDLTESEAMGLMQRRGFQEEGEAAGKWRRALLTSAQLSTYFVGYLEVRELAADLARAYPSLSVRDRHDELLRHGSPAPRYLRALLGL